MSGYVRPLIAEQTFRDTDGSVINYGHRWGSEGPPETSYSVDAHPDSFAPLHLVAEALIDYLKSQYDAKVIDDLSCAGDLWRPRSGVSRAVRVTPAAADATPLTFVFTDYPGVVVHAGLVHDFTYPTCGCDACDESWSSVADELEFAVEAIVTGRYSEEITRRRGALWIWSQLSRADGSDRRRGGSLSHDPPAELDAAAARLRALPDGRWAAWPRRTA